jgi:hypothetical protein
LDWAIQTKCDIFSYSFNEAFELQMKWHKELFKRYNIEELKIQEIDNERVLYRCSDKKHFIYLLEEKDLKYEGSKMSNCVGGENYKSKVRNNRSIIISLRDNKNNPHLTIEIDTFTKIVIQQYGKGNSSPLPEYKNMILEFILFATNYDKLENNEIIKLLNLNQTI